MTFRLSEAAAGAAPSAGAPGSVHLVGVLGAGMSALARLFLDRGWRVSGTDRALSARLDPLRAAGARISIGDAPSDLSGVDLVVCSPAVAVSHPDVVRARGQGLRVVTRACALSELIAQRPVISVAGSHGKTTTTAMLAALLDRAGQRPGFMIGEACPALDGRNARWSDTGSFVNESCEAFRALDFWQPAHCIVTGIDDEHSDHYGTFADLRAAFGAMLRRVPADGRILLCSDDAALWEMASALPARAETYGTEDGAAWVARIHSQTAQGISFDVLHHGRVKCAVRLPLPGRHNALNALAAIAMAAEFGCAPAWSAQVLAGFVPVPRRWQALGAAAGVQIYDDIAHHPSEMAVTLDTARRAIGPQERVVAVWQPQLFSRLARLEDAFARALSAADEVVLLPIDAAGEAGSAEEVTAALCARLQADGGRARAVRTLAEALAWVANTARAGDCVVTMGPALAHDVARALPDALARRARTPAEAAPPPDRPASAASALHAWFELGAHRHPDAPCLIEGERRWTYGELNTLAERAAACLLARGLPREALVVLALQKSARFLALVLGALKAGCAFVPIDPAMRRSGMNDLLHRVGTALVIEETAEAPATALPTLDLEAFWAEVEQAPPAPGTRPPRPGDLAYAIFTSGSTGSPRLVGVTHENVATLIGYSTRQLFAPEDLALAPFIDSISFDASVHQIFATVSSGGCLLLAQDLPALVRSPQFARITTLGGTPSVIGRLVDSGALPDGLRVVSLGGEVIPQPLLTALGKSPNLKKIYNFYGPTETTIFSTAADLMRADRGRADRGRAMSGTNIGQPVPGTVIRILGPDGAERPDGEPGEITIFGTGVARGYLGDPVETAVRFGRGPGGRLFRTGDLGRRLDDGSIEFLGRMDDQIKINGMRMDPTEIECQLESLPGIARAAVVQRAAENGSAMLLAFVVCADGGVDVTALRQHLADGLPAVMVPRQIIQVDSLPMTASGKVLRRALAAPPAAPPDADRGVPSDPPMLDGVARRLLLIWRSVLNRPDLPPEEDYFEAGGDSLASMQMVLMVEKAFGIRLPAQTLERIGRLPDLAADIRRLIADPSTATKARADIGAQLLDRQRAYLAAWTDGTQRQGGFIRSLDGQRGPAGLVWCCQGFHEYRALAQALRGDLPVYGMRSGHLIMEYSPDTIQSLAMLYCEELLKWQPQGPFLLGGNCQGATIARATALALRARGRRVSALILMEQFSIWPYDQPVGLIFGRDSLHNPFTRAARPEAMLNTAYPAGYCLRIVDGGHGAFFQPQNIASLAAGIRALLPGAAASDQPGATISR